MRALGGAPSKMGRESCLHKGAESCRKVSSWTQRECKRTWKTLPRSESQREGSLGWITELLLPLEYDSILCDAWRMSGLSVAT